MIEVAPEHAAGSSHSKTALGRVTLLVEIAGGTEKVTYERRCAEASSARAWCEQKLADAPDGVAVIEIQVTEEVWGRRHGWEAMASRHIPETLQLGLRSEAGSITWGATLPVGDDAAQRTR
ncbi:MAG TPA: hypothetical protein VFE07_00475 [Marmoricola sp.]|nr:hypothetical protein [Marmoricola sp.]